MNVDADKYQDIAYTYHKFCSPVNSQQIDDMIYRLDVRPGDPVIDMGCGKAELLIRLAEHCQVKAIGVDPSEQLIQDAHEAFHTRAPGIDIRFEQSPLPEYDAGSEQYQVVMCVNASQMYGGYDNALVALYEMVCPGGMLLMGQFYWADTPSDAQKIAVNAAHYDYANTIQRGIEQGLLPVYVSSSDTCSLDRYHWLKTYAIEQHTAQHMNAPDTANLLEHARSQRDLYMTGLRDVLGFGLFLFKKPAEDSSS